VGSNPAMYWMDVSGASYYIFNEKGNKGSKRGHTKKKYLKKTARSSGKQFNYISNSFF
jgi:hypothetical protein